ncbi:aspartate--tRNA ligase [Candidatus Xianfuyuplasma coldseepsis]|uniref:Aspartate--tRNA ligase n=1 Tax=Candidatus Xianfuyuplasma coldseepsis TaxID=2782163 RepID=A0A7L7KT54_9MOLU|nr:aspartate--tRNA ligase [Xianfuyuplasma coldseepsis]QMS85887.1 aspartate--tRNA ligase [Xianfuyuplasma coldseepsis]
MNRTHTNGELRLTDLGKTVTLSGWVAKKRDLGGLVFIDLRDRYGITQLAFNPDSPLYSQTLDIKSEYVLEITGTVIERSSKNPQLPTGDIEVDVASLTVLNKAKLPPLLIQDETDALENTRLKYRYLDLRRPVLQENFIVRHKTVQAVREFLNNEDFLDVETPILTKSTPEGARDYLVPSRLNEGKFYALPQSPQIFKQLLMVAGFEKYYQIAKCFRDEDLRSDRQPEFTQIDIEMSFMSQEDVLDVSERMIKYVMKKVKGIDLTEPFPRMTYNQAMNKYGVDKPDTRFDMKLVNITQLAAETTFGVFTNNIENGGIVKGITVKNGAELYSRKGIDKLTDFVKKLRAKGLAFVKLIDGELSGSIVKFFTDEQQQELISLAELEDNDLFLIVSDKAEVVHQSLGLLRNHIAKEQQLVDPEEYDFLWVIDWPMFEYRDEHQRYFSLHHPFTMVQETDIPLLDTAPDKALAYCYDLVVQGQELGGGSIRIHREDIQNKVFDILGISKEEQQQKFGFLLDALQYGTPPHGGIAFGLDRLIMLLVHTENIRDVVAFPKTNSGQCLLTEAPGIVSEEQLTELAIKTIK